MAQYGGTYKGWTVPDWESGVDLMEHVALEQEAYSALVEASDRAAAEGKIVGTLMSFPIADGAAVYIVTKERPLTLCHVPYGDAWHIPDAHLRGIRKADVEQQQRYNATMAKMFGRAK